MSGVVDGAERGVVWGAASGATDVVVAGASNDGPGVTVAVDPPA